MWWRSVQAHRYPLGYSTLQAGLRGLPACSSLQAWLPRQGVAACPLHCPWAQGWGLRAGPGVGSVLHGSAARPRFAHL